MLAGQSLSHVSHRYDEPKPRIKGSRYCHNGRSSPYAGWTVALPACLYHPSRFSLHPMSERDKYNTMPYILSRLEESLQGGAYTTHLKDIRQVLLTFKKMENTLQDISIRENCPPEIRILAKHVLSSLSL